MKITNIFTVDVEDYFHANNLAGAIGSCGWSGCESRVQMNAHKLLSILEETKVKATFFVLGWIAKEFPDIVRQIHSQGHEIANHSFLHKRVCTMTQDEFREDLKESKAVLEDIIKEQVAGYRAPTYSITSGSLWALDILREEGFEYDASFFPFRYDRRGLTQDKRFPHKIYDHSGYIWELPVSTLKFMSYALPFSSGGYFRLCPYPLIKAGIESINKKGYPAIVCIHPWEIDPQQPRLKVSPVKAFRHYYGLGRTERKLRRLLGDFNFGTVKDYINEVKSM
jgi:polysaccharide deacetylase family protein (PEP-CTERM system associated)